MIEDADVDQGQRAFQRAGQRFIGRARFSDTRRMVVGEHDGGSIAFKGQLDDFPGLDRGLRQRASE